MTPLRRRVIRPAELVPDHTQRLVKLRARIEDEHERLDRWLARLRRAFHQVEQS
jgi:hypothetical protein